MQGNRQYKFRTIVPEVSCFVGNPVYTHHTLTQTYFTLLIFRLVKGKYRVSTGLVHGVQINTGIKRRSRKRTFVKLSYGGRRLYQNK